MRERRETYSKEEGGRRNPHSAKQNVGDITRKYSKKGADNGRFSKQNHPFDFHGNVVGGLKPIRNRGAKRKKRKRVRFF